MIETAAEPERRRRRRDGRWRLIWAAGLSGTCTVVIVGTLAAHVPNILDAPMATAEDGWEPKAVRLIETGGPPPPVYISWLRASDLFEVVQRPEIRILFATDGTHVRLRSATLEVVGTPCVYESPPGARLENNSTLAFIRGNACDPLRDSPTGQLKLTVGLEGRAPVGVWTFLRPLTANAAKGGAIEVMGLPGRPGPFPNLRGTLVDHLPETGVRRIDLLSYVWDWASSATWIWQAVAVSSLLLFAGLYLVTTSTVFGSAVGAACLAGAGALLWAVLMPPLQGADEPDHLLSFGLMVGRDMDTDVQALARRSHFQRMAFNGAERFRPADRDHEHAVAWSQGVHAEDTARRSPVTALLRGTAARWLDLGAARPSDVLLRLRLLHAATFAVMIGFCALLIQRFGRPGATPWALLGLGIAPTIPYFATIVGEWALFVAWSAWWSTAVLIMFEDQPRASWGGLFLGGSFGLLVATSVAALPLAPMLAVLLLGRVVLGPSKVDDGAARHAAIFWVGLAVGLALGYVFFAEVFAEGYYRGDATSGTGLQLMTVVNRSLANVAGRPWLVVLPIAVACAAEIVLGRMRPPPALYRVSRIGLSAILALFAIGVVAVVAGSIFIAWPTLDTIETKTFTGPGQYVTATLLTMGTGLRLGHFDSLTFTAFWSGFGWLDTILPDWLLAGFAGTCALAVVLLVGRLVRRREARRMGWFVCLLIGTVGSLCAYAVAGYYLHRNVHGRYLIALYLPLLVVGWRSIGEAFEGSPAARWRTILGGGGASVVIGVHAYCIVFVLERFF